MPPGERRVNGRLKEAALAQKRTADGVEEGGGEGARTR